jgi:hypothetical protein
MVKGSLGIAPLYLFEDYSIVGVGHLSLPRLGHPSPNMQFEAKGYQS